MGNYTSNLFTKKQNQTLCIHIYNMKQKEKIMLSHNYKSTIQSLPNYISNVLKSLKFKEVFDWDLHDGKIIIYYLKNEDDTLIYQYGYLLNFLDNNFKELDTYSVMLDWYFYQKSTFRLVKLLTEEYIDICSDEFALVTDQNTTAVDIYE